MGRNFRCSVLKYNQVDGDFNLIDSMLYYVDIEWNVTFRSMNESMYAAENCG